MTLANRSGATAKAAEIERSVRDELSGVAWAPLFERRIVTRRYGFVWVVHPGADLRDGGPWIYTSSSGRVRRIDFSSPSQRLLRIGAVLVLLVGVAVLASRFYPTRWCGTEVTAEGGTINVCRDPEVTDPAVVALGLLVLAALGVFYSEISGFGLTMKRRVDEADSNARNSLELIGHLETVRKTIQETQVDFADTNLRTDKRLNALEQSVQNLEEVLRGLAPGQPGRRERDPSPISPGGPAMEAEPGRASEPDISRTPSQDESDTSLLANQKMAQLANSYNLVRSTMVAGPDRSSKMEQIFTAMQAAITPPAPRDEVEHILLQEVDRGRRLVAYAYLLTDPMPDLAPSLVTAAASEDKPFGQYCALRAVSKLVESSKIQLREGLIGELNKIAVTAGHGTDRAREVSTILAANSLKRPLAT